MLKDESVKEVSEPVLSRLVEKLAHVGVVFFDEEDQAGSQKMLAELKDLHDDLETKGLTVVKISTEEYGADLGLKDLPALVQFSGGIPNVYFADEMEGEDGNGEEDGDAMLAWLEGNSEGEVVEEVTAEIIAMLREEEEYVAVLYGGDGLFESECSSQVDCLGPEEEALLAVNPDLADIGIQLVRTRDTDYPLSEHDVESFPALGLYRNGQFLRYHGSLAEEDELRKWFLDEDNLRIKGRIEDVGTKMLSYLYETDDNIVVLFYESSDRDVDELLTGLETIDEKFDRLNITLVKIDDQGAEDQFGITELPALIYIQSGIPNVYGGDLFRPKQVLDWVKQEANTTRIHEVSDIVLSRLVDKFDYLAAVFYTRDKDPAVEGLQTIAAR